MLARRSLLRIWKQKVCGKFSSNPKPKGLLRFCTSRQQLNIADILSCRYFWIKIGVDSRARAQTERGNTRGGATKKARDFTQPFIHKSTLLSTPSEHPTWRLAPLRGARAPLSSSKKCRPRPLTLLTGGISVRFMIPQSVLPGADSLIHATCF